MKDPLNFPVFPQNAPSRKRRMWSPLGISGSRLTQRSDFLLDEKRSASAEFASGKRSTDPRHVARDIGHDPVQGVRSTRTVVSGPLGCQGPRQTLGPPQFRAATSETQGPELDKGTA